MSNIVLSFGPVPSTPFSYSLHSISGIDFPEFWLTTISGNLTRGRKRVPILQLTLIIFSPFHLVCIPLTLVDTFTGGWIHWLDKWSPQCLLQMSGRIQAFSILLLHHHWRFEFHLHACFFMNPGYLLQLQTLIFAKGRIRRWEETSFPFTEKKNNFQTFRSLLSIHPSDFLNFSC